MRRALVGRPRGRGRFDRAREAPPELRVLLAEAVEGLDDLVVGGGLERAALAAAASVVEAVARERAARGPTRARPFVPKQRKFAIGKAKR